MSEWPDADRLYPVKFIPIYQSRIWGGTLLREYLHRATPPEQSPVGESWELVDRDDEMSVIANGPLAGRTLRAILERYGSAVTGPKMPHCKRFPLLVKLIDAGERLSLQVHPDEQACRELGGGAEPKTEMWYIIAARRDGKILAGLSRRATQVQLRDLLDSPEVENLMQVYPSLPGDAYFIPSGTLHAIGAGNLILEIQQNSDTTYRVSDWGRVDESGKSRELHVEKGFKAIDFRNRTSPRIAGVAGTAAHNRKFSIVSMCRHFSVDDLRLATVWRDDTAHCGSFHLISAVSHPVRIAKIGGETEGRELELAPGETALIPYAFGEYSITPLEAGEAVVVKTTL